MEFWQFRVLSVESFVFSFDQFVIAFGKLLLEYALTLSRSLSHCAERFSQKGAYFIQTLYIDCYLLLFYCQWSISSSLPVSVPVLVPGTASKQGVGAASRSRFLSSAHFHTSFDNCNFRWVAFPTPTHTHTHTLSFLLSSWASLALLHREAGARVREWDNSAMPKTIVKCCCCCCCVVVAFAALPTRKFYRKICRRQRRTVGHSLILLY